MFKFVKHNIKNLFDRKIHSLNGKSDKFKILNSKMNNKDNNINKRCIINFILVGILINKSNFTFNDEEIINTTTSISMEKVSLFSKKLINKKNNSKVDILIGTQYGDEGKGKWKFWILIKNYIIIFYY